MRKLVILSFLVIIVMISLTSCGVKPTAAIPNTPTSISATKLICFITQATPVAFMPDNFKILLKAVSGVQIFNLQTLIVETDLNFPKTSNVAITLSPDGKMLAWALEDKSIQVIRISDQKLLHTLVGHTDTITKLRFSPNGEILVSASRDTLVRIWDRNGNLVHAFQPVESDGVADEVVGISISPDGTKLAVIPSDGPVTLWGLDDYKMKSELGGTGGNDTSDVSFSPDGQWLAADLATGLFLWNISNEGAITDGNTGINSMAVAFSPDGKYLAYSDINDNNNIILSSPDGIQKIRTLAGHTLPVFSLIFSADGKLLASSDDEGFRIWQVNDGKLLFIGKSSCP